ncbi:peroxiredoxin [Heliorestis acidaminivorans]|uniref:thioredoxin-dependent peroxiredoxin n=1 Tax=Heliorestis acidaminivorans TaxID=553427 RepID=A0A6I0F0D3_9FIRM|nr:peroxiredoxin [Heliorestis acidaminivorans]KAB2952721.1 peroxiredoxin [Heliorestis acidaminivorans]
MTSTSLFEIGQEAPDFTLPASDGSTFSLKSLRGQKVILYFYSKNNTAGCTKEAVEFRELYEEFKALNMVIIGISRDTVSSHQKFIAKHDLPFLLLSDEDRSVCDLYQVLKEKMMYGKKTIGVERSTFVIDADGLFQHIFRKVKAAGHAPEVLRKVQGQ